MAGALRRQMTAFDFRRQVFSSARSLSKESLPQREADLGIGPLTSANPHAGGQRPCAKVLSALPIWLQSHGVSGGCAARLRGRMPTHRT
jgi:hypothetical protein